MNYLEMKETTVDALTSDVKARTGYFEFIKQNNVTYEQSSGGYYLLYGI